MKSLNEIIISLNTKGYKFEDTNDLYLEQPRDGLIKQELITYENLSHGVKRTTVERIFTTNGDYNDHTTISILPNSI